MTKGLFEDLDSIGKKIEPKAEGKTNLDSPYNARGMTVLFEVSNAAQLFDFENSSLTAEQQLYIMGYIYYGTKSKASAYCGVPYSITKKWYKNEEFQDCLEAAIDIVGDIMEGEMYRRAMDGSDKLLLEAVRAHKRTKYAPKSTVRHEGEIVHTFADLAKRASIEADYEEVNNEKEEKTLGVSEVSGDNG